MCVYICMHGGRSSTWYKCCNCVRYNNMPINMQLSLFQFMSYIGQPCHKYYYTYRDKINKGILSQAVLMYMSRISTLLCDERETLHCPPCLWPHVWFYPWCNLCDYCMYACMVELIMRFTSDYHTKVVSNGVFLTPFREQSSPNFMYPLYTCMKAKGYVQTALETQATKGMLFQPCINFHIHSTAKTMH